MWISGTSRPWADDGRPAAAARVAAATRATSRAHAVPGTGRGAAAKCCFSSKMVSSYSPVLSKLSVRVTADRFEYVGRSSSYCGGCGWLASVVVDIDQPFWLSGHRPFSAAAAGLASGSIGRAACSRRRRCRRRYSTSTTKVAASSTSTTSDAILLASDLCAVRTGSLISIWSMLVRPLACRLPYLDGLYRRLEDLLVLSMHRERLLGAAKQAVARWRSGSHLRTDVTEQQPRRWTKDRREGGLLHERKDKVRQ
ncbi:uncharacterized protein V1510DRAFT_419706 [Dipodascopsis tothii]|uniref:uncharacterized protein n=1 Tax=Dipodascopsis tothii TaxID=44089 RepID=UPI0034CFBFC8